MIRLSIVIPFYNVEKYIAECLDSVYNQDIPEEEYEVICVNDASPDHSRDIVLEYQNKHSNLILVEHDVNKKLGAARNTGRRIARGRYIWNVDSDDMIVPNCLGGILEICEQNDLDVFLFGKLYNDGEIVGSDKIEWQEMSLSLPGIEFWKTASINNIFPVWNKIIRIAYLNDNEIYSPEINMGEDVPYSVETVLLAERIMSSDTKYYIRRENSNSMTRVMRKSPSPQTVYENSFVCARKLDDVIKRIPDNELGIIKSVRNVEKYILLNSSSFIKDMTQTAIKDFRAICRRNFRSNLFVMKVLGHKQTIDYLLFIVGGADSFAMK